MKYVMKSIYIIIFCLSVSFVNGQEKFLTKEGEVSFFSSTHVKDIEAKNNQVLSIIDAKDGEVAIAILIKSFIFEKSLMQEHFNENYLESDLYPKAKFKGKIINFNSFKASEKDIVVKGDISIHGVTKPIEIKADYIKDEDRITLFGKFILTVKDFNIRLPSVLASSLAEEVVVSFNFNYAVYSKE